MSHTDQQSRENRYLSVTISQHDLSKRKKEDKPVWEMILEVMERVPKEEINKLPTDASEQHDHYIYGIPKNS